MVSHPSPSTFSVDEESLTGSQLATLLRSDDDRICTLDCRADGAGPVLKAASRVRLPNVLFRRLQNGSLALTNVSPRLTDSSVPVVVIPGQGADGTISQALVKALRKDGYHFRVLTDSVEEVRRCDPSLCFEENTTPNERCANDVGCLNLNSLRLEPDVKKQERQRQVFPVQILPHLFLGNAQTASNQELLERHNIHHIINVTSNLPNAIEDDPRFRYLRISVDDNSSHNLIQFFPEAIAFIESAYRSGDACLVHCLAGISRSVTVCLAYLMSSRRWSLEDAYDQVLRCNAMIAPNFHFMGQLTDFERQLGLRSANFGNYSGMPPRSPSCAAEAAAASGLLTPPPTSCSASPHSSSHSAKSFE